MAKNQNKAVVLLHLPLQEKTTAERVAPGVTNFIEHPVADEAFARRFTFPAEVLTVPPLSAFCAGKTDG